MLIKNYASCWGVVLLPALCFATNLGGEWGNSLYFMQDRIDTLRPLTSAFENINLHAINIKGSDLSFYTNLNATNGFADSTRKKIEVAHLYFDWRNIGDRVDARLGRQTLYDEFGVKNIDGLKFNARLSKNFSLSGFGGATVPSRYSTSYIQNSIDTAGGSAGIKAALRLAKTDAAVSFQQDVDRGQKGKNGVDLDLAQSAGSALSLRANGVYGITEKSIDNYRVLIAYDPSEKVAVEASVYANNVKPDTMDRFSIKIFKRYTQTSAIATWSCCDKAALSGGYVVRLLEGDNINHEVEIHYDHTWYSAGFVQDVGYGGSNSEVDAGIRLFNNRQLQLEAGGSGMIYTTELISKSQIAYVGRAAVVYRPLFSWFNARLEIQQLHNQLYSSDTRVLLTTQIRFSQFTAQ